MSTIRTADAAHPASPIARNAVEVRAAWTRIDEPMISASRIANRGFARFGTIFDAIFSTPRHARWMCS
ncbi:MAG TPA: hypothetical protein VG713_02990, partial [Pirellulales bacterium]|nr:hypothetical protein [Pirellulales bacterium]